MQRFEDLSKRDIGIVDGAINFVEKLVFVTSTLTYCFDDDDAKINIAAVLRDAVNQGHIPSGVQNAARILNPSSNFSDAAISKFLVVTRKLQSETVNFAVKIASKPHPEAPDDNLSYSDSVGSQSSIGQTIAALVRMPATPKLPWQTITREG